MLLELRFPSPEFGHEDPHGAGKAAVRPSSAPTEKTELEYIVMAEYDGEETAVRCAITWAILNFMRSGEESY